MKSKLCIFQNKLYLIVILVLLVACCIRYIVGNVSIVSFVIMAPKATGLERVELLKMLHKAKPKMRLYLLKTFPNEVVKLLSECALNILKGNVILKKGQKARLRRHRKKLHTLADKKVTRAEKEKVIQTGGFLPQLLGTVIGPLVAPLVQEVAKAL